MTDATSHHPRFAYLLMAICPALFCSNMIMAKAMVGILPPLMMACLRWALVGVVLSIALWPQMQRHTEAIMAEWKSWMFLGGLGMGLCGGPVYLAAELTTATNIGLIYATSPLLMLMISVLFFAHRLMASQFVGLVMGLGGVGWILIRGDLGRLADLQLNGGDLWICMCTLAFAVYSVGLKQIPSQLPALVRLAMMAFGGAIWHLPFVVAELTIWGREFVPSWQIVYGLIVLVFVASLGAYVTYGKIVELVGAPRAGVVLYIVPVYNAGLALMLLGESLSSFHIIGTALILPGVWLANRSAA